MFNPATRPPNKLNDFTRFFTTAKEGWPGRTEEFWIKLRNGDLVRPVLIPAEDATCEDCFGTGKYRWNLDGTSVTNREYDMMELVIK